MSGIITDLSVNTPWQIASGFKNTFTITALENSVAFSLASRTFSVEIRKIGSQSNFIQLTQASGITNGGASGILTIVLTAAQSAQLGTDNYFFQLTCITDETRWINGTITATTGTYSGDLATDLTANISLSGDGVTLEIAISGGDVSGPSSSTDDHLAVFNGATGKVIKDSGIGISPKVVQVACSDEITAISAGTGKATFRMPYAMTLTAVRASLTTAQASGNIFTVDILMGGVTVLSTLLTINNTSKTSVGASTPAVISVSALTSDAEMSVSVTQIGNGTAIGLKVTLIGS